MIKEDELEPSYFEISREYWEKILYKKYKKVPLNRELDQKKVMKSKQNISIKSDRFDRIIEISKGDNLMIYLTMLTVFEIAMVRISQNSEFFIGIPQYLKSKDLKNNNPVILLNSNVNENDTVKEVLINKRKETLEAYKYQFYPLKELYKVVNIYEKFNLYCCMKNIHDENQIQYIENLSNNDIVLIVEKHDDCIELSFNYYNGVLNDEVNVIINIFNNVLNSFIKNVDVRVKDIEILSKEEKDKLLVTFNDTAMDYPRNKTIQELFEIQVEKTPENIAVVYENNKLTYRELNERANSLAVELRNKGVKADSIVGIMTDRSVEMIVGIMGILKSGGAYLPIDPEYPKERIKYILQDSGCKILLSTAELLNGIECDLEVIDLNNEDLFNSSIRSIENINSSKDLAYVIYTSGTTGNPKGVMIEHRNVNNLVEGLKRNIYSRYEGYLRVALIAPYYFDASVQQIFASLLNGHELYIVPEDSRTSGEEIIKYYEKNRINISDGTPVHLSMIANSKVDNNLELKHLIIGGDALDIRVVKKIYETLKNVKISNVYGPTECCVDSSVFLIEEVVIDKLETLPIGKPMTNYKLYIVDKYDNEVPIGIPGQLCVAGHGLSRGYLNRVELTEEKFVNNPFERGTKMYKTGDLAKWLPDGNIEFLGRMDNQVKIRGFRIELGEIENTILRHEEVKEAVVLVKNDKNNEKYICAYVVSDKEINDLNLRGYLKQTLPEYMVPAYFIKIKEMPITANGKIDRRKLPEPNVNAVLNKYEAPRNELEETLVKLWCEVLGVERLGINDNFFEMGGHSLKATVLISRIHKELKKEMTVKELFKAPTIKELSNVIQSLNEKVCVNIEKVEEKEYYAASSAQKRMYMLQQFEKNSTAYNMPMIFELKGEIIVDRIEETLKTLVSRHDALRTHFENLDGEIIQKIQKHQKFKLVEKKEVGDIEQIVNRFIRPFTLEKSPLFRAEIVENKEKIYLLMDMHHIISDGISMNILVREFEKIYNCETLENLKLQYKDFTVWQKNFLNSEEIRKQEEYWLDRFSDEVPVLNMPIDYERPIMQSFEGDDLDFEIKGDLTARLRDLARETNSTMHMVLLSAFHILLSKYSGQEDVVIGTPIAGRPHADLQNIMGIFINTLALRNSADGEKEYIKFLEMVRDNSLKAYDNQSYQIELLIDKLKLPRDTSRTPLFNVMFNMIDTIVREDIKLDGLSLIKYDNENKISQFDLTLNALEYNDTLKFKIEYCSKLFKKQTIERLSGYYIKILETITSNSNIKIGEIELLSENEKNEILYKFNDTKAEYCSDKTIQEIFEEQVEKTPDNIAAVYEDTSITYRELNKKANSLARVLRQRGVKPEKIVGIMVDRSIDMIVGVIAIIKSGGAYMPIDPNYPDNRIDYMLSNSNADILITESSLIKDKNINCNIVDIKDEEIYSEDGTNLEITNTTKDLIYVIYTSGTTGNPKGVMLEQRNLINMVYSWIENYKLSDFKVNLLQMASMAFDVFTGDICRSLLTGGTMYICPNDTKLNMKKLYELIRNNEISILESTPSLIITFMEYVDKNSLELDNIKLLILGSDSCPITEYKKLVIKYEGKTRVLNSYGVTEATIDSSYYEERISDIPQNLVNTPIGKPLQNTKFYILNDAYKLVAIGAVGELYIGGRGVARGYYNNEDLTRSKFIVNPFEEEELMYKTGDLARWLPDGNVEFLGRIDNQVKIRGFRIELGEIENKLLELEEIKEVVVVDRKGKDGNTFLCAYIVSATELNVKELRSNLEKVFPNYMIPAYFMQIDKIPLTSNGKVDRRALDQIEIEISRDNEYQLPANELEEIICDIWSEVLEVKNISVAEDFFYVGGDSIKAIKVASLINSRFNVSIEIADVFLNKTIRELADVVKNRTSIGQKSKINDVIEQFSQKQNEILKKNRNLENIESIYPMSDIEKGMVYHSLMNEKQFKKDGNLINQIQSKIKIKITDFDVNTMEKALKLMTEKHENLRASFNLGDYDSPMKMIHKEIMAPIKYRDISHMDKKEQEISIEQILSEDMMKPFDFKIAPLWRVNLFSIDTDNIVFAITYSQAILDGWSLNIFLPELLDTYYKLKCNKDYKLIPLKCDYKRMVANEVLNATNQECSEFWKGELDGYKKLNFNNLSNMYGQSNGCNHYVKDMGSEVFNKLGEIASKYNTSIKNICFTSYIYMMKCIFDEEDILVATMEHNRPVFEDSEKVLGCYLNMNPVRMKITDDMKIMDAIGKVEEKMKQIHKYGNISFYNILRNIGEKTKNENSVSDTMFNYINFHNYERIGEELFKETTEEVTGSTNTLLDLNVDVTTGRLGIMIASNSFDDSILRKYVKYFEKFIEHIIHEENYTIGHIENGKNKIDNVEELMGAFNF